MISVQCLRVTRYLHIIMLLILALVATLLYLLYLYLQSFYTFWDKSSIAVLKPKYPIFGNSFEFLFSLKPAHKVQLETYRRFSKERFVGSFTFLTPTLFIRDPDLIEDVTIKQFASAANRGNREDPRASKLSTNLLNTTDAHWKSLRNKLTPTFSSGKLKGMHGQLVECADSLVNHLSKFETSEPLDARDVISRFTTDVIASCAFGLNINTLDDPNSMFRTVGKAAFTFSVSRKLLALLNRLLGSLSKWFNIRVTLTKDMVNFFIDAVDSTLEYRKNNQIYRPDFLQLMNDLMEKDKELIKAGRLDPNDPHIFDHSTLVSNAFVFFIAGFETTASTISYMMYELALNEDVQEKLHQEVLTVLSKSNGQLTFEACQDMTYMEYVISETLRLYPTVPAVSRKVNKAFSIPNSNVEVPVDSLIVIPIYALQHDPQYFVDPEKFKPERFNPENGQIRNGTYLPFGSGPRICIGARFAKLEIKVAIAKMLLKYKITKCQQTQVPLTFSKESFLLVPEKSIWISVTPRATA